MGKKVFRLVVVFTVVLVIILRGTNVWAKNSHKFYYVKNDKIYDTNDNEFQIKAINLSNSLSATNAPKIPMEVSTTESTYKEISSMGFNTARFLINYQILEDDDTPYVYKQTGWDWIDKNIAWAKEYHINLIIDMHIPQGGYQSQGDGLEIWQADNQQRLIALWKAIAERYADEKIIIGYGLVNEPQVTSEDYLYLWDELANCIVYAIRTVDANHICFVQPCGSLSGSEYLYPSIDSDNIVYENHVYPFNYLKQWRKTANNNFNYGEVDLTIVPEDERTVIWQDERKNYVKDVGTVGKWTTVTNVIEIPDGVNAASVSIQVGALNYSDGISIKNIYVYEFDQENVFQRTVYNSNNNHAGTVNRWAKNGNAKSIIAMKYDETANETVFTIKNARDYLGFADESIFKYFSVDFNKKYVVTYDIRVDSSVSNNVFVVTQLSGICSNSQCAFDKEYLKSLITCAEAQNENIPFFIGEIGFTRNELDNDESGYKMLVDCLDIMMDNQYHFAYFNYHSSSHGLYTGSSMEPIKNLNKTLKDILQSKLNN